MAIHNNDDAFAAFAKQAEIEAKERQKAPGGTFQFEDVQWTGLNPNVPKIVRAVGGAPDSNEDKGTAVTRRISWIIGDNGKKFRVVFPEKQDDPDHLMWRMIAAVNETTYINKKKVFIHENKNPELFRMVNKNGLEETDKKAMYDSGWLGKTKFIMNVIDREQMKWHAEHKHTLLLSKSVSEGSDGRVFADEGVPAFGFANLLATGIFKFYKDWRKYDLGITKTGLKETPYRIINATKYKEEIPDELQALVSEAPWLTEEELSWETYDLQKLFKYTPMTKIYNNLKISIQKLDARLGTKFDKMFKDAVDKEAEAKELSKDDNEVTPDTSDDKSWNPMNDVVEAAAVPEAPKTRERKAESSATSLDTSVLKGWDNINEEERALITAVKTERGQLVVTYNTQDEILKCSSCGVGSPESFGHCPSCGITF